MLFLILTSSKFRVTYNPSVIIEEVLLKRGIVPEMISFEQLPAEVADRSVPRHWEDDLIVGKDHKSASGALVE